MPYRLFEKMPQLRYFDIVDELIIKWIETHLNTPCDSCKDKDMASALCDECSIYKVQNGKESTRNTRM